MALKNKYGWNDFLKTHPEAKQKGLKRISDEGKKAFEAAQKEFLKGYLKQREEQYKKFQTKAEKVKSELVKKLKAVDGRHWHLKARDLNRKIGRLDSYLAKLSHQHTRNKEAAKHI